jgi:putative transposase
VVKLPDHFEGKAEFLAELERRIGVLEDECARERQQSGRSVLGRKRVLCQSWKDSPSSREPRRGLRPRVAARNKWLRIMRLQCNKDFEVSYRAARKSWIAGMPAEFPFGTYWLRRFANVRVKPRDMN